jgi:hypothetical protein
MKGKLNLMALVSLVTIALVAAGCASTTVTTTVPAVTVTLPGGTTTLPAATVTLPSGTTTILTTIPATVVTVTPVTTTLVPVPTNLAFLPTAPDSIPYDMGALTDCVSCHGPGLYLQFPLPPSWNGSVAMSPNNVAIYAVVPGSIQDHTARIDSECLTCHEVY